jgi:uncharacterized protein (DUF433 family)
MTLVIHADPVPLCADPVTGVIRVGNSRVTLDTLLAEYRKGASPEKIAEEFDAITLADVHFAIAYYLRHQDEVNAYLRWREAEAVRIRKDLESLGIAHPEMSKIIQERWSQRE